VGFRETLRLVQGANALSEQPALGRIGIRSPWQAGQLSKVVWSDILGSDELPVTRAEAMSVPAIKRARDMVCADIASMQLKAYKGADEVATQPAWLYRSKGRTSPQHRMIWTVDDLIFGGWSLWAVERATGGAIVDGLRIPPALWSFGDDDEVIVGDEPVTEDEVILFPGLHEGILNSSGRTIRGARKLENIWATRAARPVPAAEAHQTNQAEMTQTEIDDLVDDISEVFEDAEGGVFFTPWNVELKTHGGEGSSDLIIQGRNAAAIDGARSVGVPAALVDASNVNSTLTYETVQGRNLEYIERSLKIYTLPISAVLSMDNATPRGTRIAFDTSTLSGPFQTSGTPTED
jgi:hypothetical protein